MAKTTYHSIKYLDGYENVINKYNSSLKYLGFGSLSIKAGEKFVYEVKDEEIAIVLQEGDFTADVEWKGNASLKNLKGYRQDVFEELPTAIYLPPDSKIIINTKEGMKARVFTAPCDEGNEPFYCPPEKVEQGEPGANLWKRKYRFIFGPPNKHNSEITKKLIVGESISVPGGWVGLPGHRHDFMSENESDLEEIFSIRVKSDKGGFVIVYSFENEENNEWDEVHIVKNDDNAIALSEGYHTSLAAPGCVEYLLWGLSGKEKIYKVKFDERFTELEDALY